ncbi:MAG: energy transducer TonB [Gammaproteobacteria bacterium]|nr:MAG: energy transducer TonB [Gammaproteobacteria bacterium]
MASINTSPFSQPTVSVSDSLLISLFFAAIVHAFILLGINFTIPTPEKVNKQIEITLASTPAKKAPKKAKFLAQDNQIGAGKQAKKPAPPKQKTPSQGNKKNKKPAKQKTQKASKPKATKKIITQKVAEQKIVSNKKQATPTVAKKSPKITAESLQRQIAQLGTEIRQSQQHSEKTKIKFVNSVSTHKYVAAQYMKDWEHKVERTGNLNYPEVARKKGFSGTLTMDVGIKPDGSIYSIRITQSSGNKALDDAAKRIVRLSAPFAALPKELLNELDILVIPRVWKFSDESGITTR